MKFSLFIIAPLAALVAQSQLQSAPADPGWPREINRDGVRLVYHQPQIDEWKNYRALSARVAFSLTPKAGKPALGVAEVEGSTSANLEAGMVVIQNIRLKEARFPSLSAREAASMEEILRRTFPSKGIAVSLDRLLAGVERGKDTFNPVEVRMDPPPIFSSSDPSVLLIVEGKPVLAPVEGTNLQFVVNANWDLFYEPDNGRYFLLVDKTWLASTTLDGEWTLATKLPKAMADLPEDWAEVKKALPLRFPKGTRPPQIIFSNQPAELIVLNGGSPVLTKIQGTHLLWATNTQSKLFFNSADSNFYYLVTGRWFRATKLAGPWSYAGNDLPEDFKLIPSTHECADVLASVQGTPEAEDAVLLAQLPTEATLKCSEAESKVKVSYDGAPQFEPVVGTTLSYARNTSADVIKVENQYYCCSDAVWFVAGAPLGPWRVARVVPPVIYTIPPACPLYRVTYARVVSCDDTYVVCSYTAGYHGVYIARGPFGVMLVWGSGWYYSPFILWGPRPIYRPCYATYGVAAVYNPWRGGYVIGARAYGPYASYGRAAWYNSATGGYGRITTVQGPYWGRTLAASYNPRTYTGWITRQGHNDYAHWGTTAIRRDDDWVRAGHVVTDVGGVVGWRGSEGGGRIRWNDDHAAGIARHEDTLYAGKDGNIYRHDDEGWAKYEDGEWEEVERDRPQSGPDRPQWDGGSNSRPDRPNRPETPSRPTTLPVDRPGFGNRPSTLPLERLQRRLPQIEERPVTREVRQRPQESTMNGLKRESQARDRGDLEASLSKRQQRGNPSGGRESNTPKRPEKPRRER